MVKILGSGLVKRWGLARRDPSKFLRKNSTNEASDWGVYRMHVRYHWGRPWQWDRDIMYRGRKNIIVVKKDTEKHILSSMLNENQRKVSLRGDQTLVLMVV